MVRSTPVRRREFVGWLAALGTGAGPLAGAAAAVAQDRPAFTREMMIQAEEMAGLRLTDAQRDLALPVLQNYLRNIQRVREMSIPPEVAPAMMFVAEPGAVRVARKSAPLPSARRTPSQGQRGGSK